MYLGVDYYPEYWPLELIDEDLDGIKGLGANMVRIGEFAWHLMESKEGEFDFSFYDQVITKAKQRGLEIMFGTPTATFPAWLAKKHPSILSRDEAGLTRVYGGRRQYCFNSEEYRIYSARITEKLVKHFANEPTIVVWQVDNEFGHEGSDMCYCSQCHTAFQQYLSKKYPNIRALNETYGTIFWGQTYNDFSEIPIPSKTITTHNPSLQLDWARFRSYSLNRYAHELTDIVRSHKGEHQQVTTNASGGFFSKWFDHDEHMKPFDFVSYDNYPVWGGLAEPIPPAEIAMTLDFNRGLKGQNFWIVEELMGAQGHNVIGYLPRPDQAKMWSYQAFAHGCSDMLYFCWRGMTRGAEQFCYGIVDHDNKRGRKYEEVQRVFSGIQPYATLLQSEIVSEVAVLYDYDNVWSWRFQQQSEAFDFKSELMRLYAPFHGLNVHMDVIPADRDFTKYKVLVVPVLQIIDQRLGERLAAFAKQGGTVLFSYRTGLKDKNNNIHFGIELPGFVREMTGVVVEGTEALPAGVSMPIVESGASGRRYACMVWRDLLTPVTAETLYSFDDPFYPKAAVTRNSYGQGTVYYVGGGVDSEVLNELAEHIVKQQQICHIESEAGIEVYERTDGQQRYWFIMNHTAETRMFHDHKLAPYESKIVEV
ncbi:beta-galactosidase [Paenibacillus rigui]|uniref:Beta-galactosidase n=1 Tax=Paenibacillus rigui TaxID=554312 RepID=A0A229UJ05_9BACL|nr:beta-galactosidase [Paenibacillus rigui]OXM83438.1 beta-galactosidase [Paenibacillus rigui]